MKQTLEIGISTSVSKQSIFIVVLSILIVLVMPIISNFETAANFEGKMFNIFQKVWIFFFYIVLISAYHFITQSKNEKRVKILNHLNLIIAFDEQKLNN